MGARHEMTVCSVATYSAIVRGDRYAGYITQTDTGSWQGCVLGEDVIGQLAALRPIAETYESCIVRTNSPEIIAAIERFRDSACISTDADVEVSRLLAECDLRPILQPESELMIQCAARALVRGTFAYGVGDLVRLQLSRCTSRTDRARMILDRTSRPALAVALGINLRTVHGWVRRGVGSPHVDTLAELLDLPPGIVR